MQNGTALRLVDVLHCADIIEDALWVQPRSLPDLMVATGASDAVFAKAIRAMLKHKRVIWFGYSEHNESLWALVSERVLLAIREGARSVKDLHRHFLDMPSFQPDTDAVGLALEVLIGREQISESWEPLRI